MGRKSRLKHQRIKVTLPPPGTHKPYECPCGNTGEHHSHGKRFRWPIQGLLVTRGLTYEIHKSMRPWPKHRCWDTQEVTRA